MSRALDLKFARAYRAAAEKRFPDQIEDVRIFGSRARGDFHADSDLDLFVEIRQDDYEVRKALMSLAWDVANEIDLPYPATPHVMHHDHFERLKRLEGRFARDILVEGIPV